MVRSPNRVLNNFARWLQKIVACQPWCDAMCWCFSDAMTFCNNVARWLQKIVAHEEALCWCFSDAMLHDAIRCSNVSRMLWPIYPSQTKILEWWTKDEIRIFEYFSRTWVLNLGHEPWKSASKIRMSSFVPPCNNFMLPKRRCWKDEQKRKSGFSTDFSIVRSPNRVLTPLKWASFEIRISDCVHPSRIFVWEG